MMDDVLGITWYRKRKLMIGGYVISENIWRKIMPAPRISFRIERLEYVVNTMTSLSSVQSG